MGREDCETECTYHLELDKIEAPLSDLIRKYGITEYIRDYYAALNGYLKIQYAEEDFYIAEDVTCQPWFTVMGIVPEKMTEERLRELLLPYIASDRYIAVCTNIEQVSGLLEKQEVFTYHENFWVASIGQAEKVDCEDIRLATVEDLPFIEKTYRRSGHQQLLNRIQAEEFWIAASGTEIKGYAGIHKDGSLGFEYVAEKYRRQHVGSRLQNFVADYMIKNNRLPYVMISEANSVGVNLQKKMGAHFADEMCYFYAKGPYELE